MEWIDTHVHISGVSPDGSVRENLAQDVAVVLDGAGADLRFVVNCCEADSAAEFQRMMERPEGVLEASRHVHGLAKGLAGRVYGSCMVNPHFLDASLKTMDVTFGQWRFVMLGEMVQYMMHYRMNSDPVARLVRKAVEFDVPTQVHIRPPTAPRATSPPAPRNCMTSWRSCSGSRRRDTCWPTSWALREPIRR